VPHQKIHPAQFVHGYRFGSGQVIARPGARGRTTWSRVEKTQNVSPPQALSEKAGLLSECQLDMGKELAS